MSRFAYADPPYLGEAVRLYGDHPEAAVYDTVEGHAALVERLASEYDGWALSLHAPSLRAILPLVPPEARICAWVKPWHRMHPGARLQWGWEPVIIRPLRPPSRSVSDWVSANATMLRGLPGAKPEEFCWWLFAAGGLTPDDEFTDVFPGSGAVAAAWERYRSQRPLTLASGTSARKRANMTLEEM